MKEKKKKDITVNYQSSRSSGHRACERGRSSLTLGADMMESGTSSCQEKRGSLRVF